MKDATTHRTPDRPLLWNTQEVCKITGWSRSKLSLLCSQGKIPFIAGRPNKFIPEEIRKALTSMQTGRKAA